MAKKKKPTLKAAANRGFATTSVPSKKVDAPGQAETEEQSSPDDQGRANGSASAQSGDGFPRQTASVSAQAPTKNELSGFDDNEEDVEMQLLGERLNERAAREVARLWKVGVTQ